MLLSFPQMGSLDLVLGDILERLDIPYAPPPRTSSKTVALGAKYSPEFACLPLKLNIGNFVEALEAGADSLLMAGGQGPCRFGYYSQIEERILRDAGYDFRMVTVEPPTMGISRFVGPIKSLSGKSTRAIWRAIKEGFPKARAFDLLEKKVLATRCYEQAQGETTRAHKRAKEILSAAKTPAEIEEAGRESLSLIDRVQQDRDRAVLRVGFLGEFFILLEPFANFDVEEWLGNRGVEVSRSVYLTDWISPSSKNAVGGESDETIAGLARPFLGHSVGGEGLATVGHAVLYAQGGYDGLIHMLPFTCMPETIAKAILPKVSRDLDIPMIHFTIDEQTGKAGVTTRLEAFIDLLAGRRRAGRAGTDLNLSPIDRLASANGSISGASPSRPAENEGLASV
jgi:predicted nucleotide-binding protein (sugar kinase/HSP70/actin superfamily)